MKKLVYRVLCFSLDILLCSAIIYGLSLIDFINPNANHIRTDYKDLMVVEEQYNEFTKNIDSYFEDGMVTEREIIEIDSKYPYYVDTLDGITLNEDITNDEIEKVKTNAIKNKEGLTNAISVDINRLSWPSFIISVVVYVLYFGVLQYFLNGQTPFKRLFRVKVVKVYGGKMSLISYIIRAILVTEILVTLLDIILVLTLKVPTYINANYWVTGFKYIYELAFLITMFIRDDTRSLHDLLLGTEVIKFDKYGKRVEDVKAIN